MLEAVSIENKEIVRKYLNENFERSSLIVNYLGNLEKFNVQILMPKDFSLSLSSQLQRGGTTSSVDSALSLKLRLKKMFSDSKNLLLFSEDIEFKKDDYTKNQFRRYIELAETPNSTLLTVKKPSDSDICAEFDLLTKASNSFFSVIGVCAADNLNDKDFGTLTAGIIDTLIEAYISCFDKESYLIVTRRIKDTSL
jgi:hypothetical protein